MDPVDYSDEILDKKFQVLTPVEKNDFKRTEGYIRQTRYWSHPPQFTIREARDGVEHEHKKTGKEFFIIKATTTLEKLRKAKPGKVVKMINSYRRYNNWFVILIDEKVEQDIEETKLRLEAVNIEIKEKVGDLLKEQKDIREKLKSYKIFY